MTQPKQKPASLVRLRLIYLAIAMSVVPIGLIARSLRGDTNGSTAFGFVTLYLGDTLWAVMFFYLFSAFLVKWRARSLAILTFVVTLGIELSQIYAGEPLATLRSFKPTRFLLGTNFLWSDVVCLIVGTALAVTLHAVLRAVMPSATTSCPADGLDEPPGHP